MEFEFFYGYNHPLSQWYYSDFVIDGIKFNCCEQWMMYSKAILFHDNEKAEAILKEPRANFQRKFGRQVRFFKNEIWLKERKEIVYKGNLQKFQQNQELASFLRMTGNKVLAEASPSDLIWGIGLSDSNPDRFYPEKWPGENLLGEILMNIRTKLNT